MKRKLVTCIVMTACLCYIILRWALAPLFTVYSVLGPPGETTLQCEMRIFRPNLIRPEWLSDKPQDVLPEAWAMIEQNARLVLIIVLIWVSLWIVVFRNARRSSNQAVSKGAGSGR